MRFVARFVAGFEGYARRLADGGCQTYLDPIGVPTIGHGTTGKDVRLGLRWTREQADGRFDSDLRRFELGVGRLSPVLWLQSETRRAAVISFAYNCGLGNYKSSTLRKCVDREDWQGAARQLLRWNKAGGRVLPGLTRRRAAEAKLMLDGGDGV